MPRRDGGWRASRSSPRSGSARGVGIRAACFSKSARDCTRAARSMPRPVFAETAISGGRCRSRDSIRGRTSSIVDLGLVPLREDDERRAPGLAGDVGDGEVLLDDPLGRRRSGRARRRPARPPRARAAPSSSRSPAAACACAAGPRCRRGGTSASSRSQDRVDRVARRARHVGDDHALRADERVEERRLADVRPAEDRDADRLVADRAACALAREPRDDLVEQVAGAVAVQRRRAGPGRRARAGGTRPRRGRAAGRRSCSRARSPACATRAGSRRAPRRPA